MRIDRSPAVQRGILTALALCLLYSCGENRDTRSRVSGRVVALSPEGIAQRGRTAAYDEGLAAEVTCDNVQLRYLPVQAIRELTRVDLEGGALIGVMHNSSDAVYDEFHPGQNYIWIFADGDRWKRKIVPAGNPASGTEAIVQVEFHKDSTQVRAPTIRCFEAAIIAQRSAPTMRPVSNSMQRIARTALLAETGKWYPCGADCCVCDPSGSCGDSTHVAVPATPPVMAAVLPFLKPARNP